MQTPARYVIAAIILLGLLNPCTLAAKEKVLIDPKTILSTANRIDFVGKNDFTLVKDSKGIFLRSIPRNSASGLYQHMDVDGKSLTRVRWTWRVDQLQPSADLRHQPTEDAAATVFFVFGEPTFFDPDVPTLAYSWSATPVPLGTVLIAPRYKNLVTINLRGVKSVGSWQTENRDIAQDFRTYFGRQPDALKYVAMFNDNDQTGEPTSALFGKIVDAH